MIRKLNITVGIIIAASKHCNNVQL